MFVVRISKKMVSRKFRREIIMKILKHGPVRLPAMRGVTADMFFGNFCEATGNQSRFSHKKKKLEILKSLSIPYLTISSIGRR
jgi:hypothetical protein